MNNSISTKEITLKLEHFCSYQERCHVDVVSKLFEFNLSKNEADEIIVHLIQYGFLNEERFSYSFARGKHRIKQWGRIRIIYELKLRHISQFNINRALKEISDEEYFETFEKLSEKTWENSLEKNALKKRKKFCNYLLRKGYESNLVYEKVKKLEKLSK